MRDTYSRRLAETESLYRLRRQREAADTQTDIPAVTDEQLAAFQATGRLATEDTIGAIPEFADIETTGVYRAVKE